MVSYYFNKESNIKQNEKSYLSQHTYVCFLLISLLKISFSNLKNKKLKYQTEGSYYISNNKICTPVLKNWTDGPTTQQADMRVHRQVKLPISIFFLNRLIRKRHSSQLVISNCIASIWEKLQKRQTPSLAWPLRC